MSQASVTAVRSVEFGVADLDTSRAFYEDVWGLVPVDRDGSAHYLRASGPEHHAVVLRRAPEPGLLRATFAAADRAAIDALYERVIAAGGKPFAPPGAVDAPGGGYGFSFTDPEGRELAVVADVARHGDAAPLPDRPFKISHVVLNAVDCDRTTAFLREALGMRLRDATKTMTFLGCNADHHSVAVTRVGNVSLNHVAFELPSWDAVMRGSGRLRRNGYDIEWGPGRHGPGSNVFAYFIDPNELPIEYTANIDQIDDATYRIRPAEEWVPPIQGNPDYWGFADPPSPRFQTASHGRTAAHAR